MGDYMPLYENEMKISGAGFAGWTRWALISAAFLWIFIFIFLFHSSQDFAQHEDIAACPPYLKNQLADALSEIHELRNENERLNTELTAVVDSLEKLSRFRHASRIVRKLSTDVAGDESRANVAERHAGALYSREHEVSKRLLRNVIYETFLLVKAYVDTPGNWKKKSFDLFRTRVHDQMRWLLAGVENFADEVDGAGDWHHQSLAGLTTEIQRTIRRLQHPADCAAARYLICDLNKGCGFGCQLHHVTYCLLVSVASNRTLVLDNDGKQWRYSRNGWNAVFKPVSGCSYTNVEPSTAEPFSGVNQTAKVVHLPIIDILNVPVDQIPQSFPKQFNDELLTHHSNPPVFFIAQFMWYLMRENDHMAEVLAKFAQNVPFNKGPIVGLQIRRTDKVGTEAAFHSVDEYMEWSELWFRRQEARRADDQPLKRRVFVATDDPTSVDEIKHKYTNYEVYFNDGSAENAQLNSRYTDASLFGIVADIRMLSKCNYLVCTFSSQVCRMGYELMQVEQGDVAERYHSLDDIYYYGGQQAHNLIATGVYRTNVSGEIELRPGDVIGIAGNHWNGFSRGLNRRTNKAGLFPSYLAREHWRIVDFPVFDERR